MSGGFHQQYLACVEEIEQRFPVAHWRCGDFEIWPLVRMDLYLDMYRQSAGANAPSVSRARNALRHACVPMTNLWRRRNDLQHHQLWPRKADAIFLGDGVSLDRIEGAWQDRYSEPLITVLAQQGRSSFLMQPGDLRRTPWHRETFPANTVDAVAHALAPFHRHSVALPALPEVQAFLAHNGIVAPSVSPSKLLWRANVVRTTSAVFEYLLDGVQPRLAFVTTWYAGLAPAFLLACRRRGILSVDLQHCPQGGGHKAYTWRALPLTGYRCLPAVFWTWHPEDAEHIQSWARASSWHGVICGGHPRLSLRDNDPCTTENEGDFAGPFDRDILVALQTVQGAADVWHRLAHEIAAGPASWRWWIRRHPAARAADDQMFAELLALRRPNVRIEEASQLPLWDLLRHMSAVVSLSSGTAGEAAAAGVPALFLSADATGPFRHLIQSQRATVCDVGELGTFIADLPARPVRSLDKSAPPLAQTLRALDGMARDFAPLCRSQAKAQWAPNGAFDTVRGRA